MTQSIGERITHLREGYGLNQSQFADRVGLAQATISMIEGGQRDPSVYSLRKIAIWLGVTVDCLIEETDDFGDPWGPKDIEIQAIVEKLKDPSVSYEVVCGLHRFLDSVL